MLLEVPAEAVRLRHDYIGTEHLLLGMIRTDRCFGIQILSYFDVPLLQLKSNIESLAVPGESEVGSNLSLNPEAKRAIEYAVEESKSMGHEHLGTGHLLIGIVREATSVGGKVLVDSGLTVEELREFACTSAVWTPNWAIVGLEKLRIAIPSRERLGGRFAKRARPPFQDFTSELRRGFTYAEEEAQRLNHNYIGTEHLLLGLIRQGHELPARLSKDAGVDLANAQAAVQDLVGRGEEVVDRDIGLTPRAKRVIELAVEEAFHLNHHHIGIEHLLLGILREGNGNAISVLKSLGVDMERLRYDILRRVFR